MTRDDGPGEERVPAYAISWLLLGCLAAAIVAGLLLMLRQA